MSQSESLIPVAVVGVGRMGRHHARTYKKIPLAKLVAVVDADAERAATVADEFGCDSCANVAELLQKYPNIRAASVAVPTVLHLQAATPLLERGLACLIEKPLAPTAALCRQLARIASDRGTIIQVGHTERFNPAVRAVLAMGVRPRFMEVQRVSPMTFRSLDVGVVMDMMIHDLDIVLTLADSALARVEATGVAVMGKSEDVANARLVFENGCVANLTASRLALKTERKLRLFSEDAYVSLDYQKRTGIVIRKADNAEALAKVREQLAAGADLSSVDYAGLVHVNELAMDLPEGQQDPLTAELTSFLETVRVNGQPEVDALAGSAAVDAAERVTAAIRDHKWEGIADPSV